MNDLILTVGLVGALSSIISLFIAEKRWKSRVQHIIYALVVTTIATIAFEYKNDRTAIKAELDRLKNAETQAKALLSTWDQSTAGSGKGNMLASLTFLEKNREFFPDTYERAKKLCESAGCTETGYSSGYSHKDNYNRTYEGASAMQYLIKGIKVTK